jgi:hypothetical protein
MSGAPQVVMRFASQSWQIFFPSQTLQVICFSFAKPSDFLFGPSQKGTICSSVMAYQCTLAIYFTNLKVMGRPLHLYLLQK